MTFKFSRKSFIFFVMQSSRRVWVSGKMQVFFLAWAGLGLAHFCWPTVQVTSSQPTLTLTTHVNHRWIDSDQSPQYGVCDVGARLHMHGIDLFLLIQEEVEVCKTDTAYRDRQRGCHSTWAWKAHSVQSTTHEHEMHQAKPAHSLYSCPNHLYRLSLEKVTHLLIY